MLNLQNNIYFLCLSTIFFTQQQKHLSCNSLKISEFYFQKLYCSDNRSEELNGLGVSENENKYERSICQVLTRKPVPIVAY